MSKLPQTTVQRVGKGNEMTTVITWAEDDLPMHVKGGAEWAIYRDPVMATRVFEPTTPYRRLPLHQGVIKTSYLIKIR